MRFCEFGGFFGVCFGSSCSCVWIGLLCWFFVGICFFVRFCIRCGMCWRFGRILVCVC